MELAFESRELRTTCESEAFATDKLGATIAEVLRHRLADFRAASSPKDLVAGRPRTTLGGQQMAVDLADSYEIVFKSNHPDCPMTESGQVEWSKVRRIKILSIRKIDA